MTDTTTQAIISTATQTAAAVLPTLAAADPKIAAVVALAPIAIQFLQSATELQRAGILPPDQLAALFGSIGQGIQSTHAEWQRMNAADASGKA